MNAYERLQQHLPLFAEARGDIQVSFEFFPPKTDKMAETLWESVQTLAPLQPAFRLGHLWRGRIHPRAHAPDGRADSQGNAAHTGRAPTCVAASRGEIDDIAREYWDLGVRYIVALRGDPPEAGTKYQPHPQGYRDAAELVEGLKKVAPFDISVAGLSRDASGLCRPARSISRI